MKPKPLFVHQNVSQNVPSNVRQKSMIDDNQSIMSRSIFGHHQIKISFLPLRWSYHYPTD